MSESIIDQSARRGWAWVPSLYFAEGLPYAIVLTVSVVMYKSMGVGNAEISFYTSWLYLPWVVKALWSPFIDIVSTKRRWILLMQCGIAIALATVAVAVATDGFFAASLAAFWVMSFLSATHDIAADGFYMYGLTERAQSWWVGLRTTFYRLALLAAQGGIVALAGYFELSHQPGTAWRLTFMVAAILFGLLALWHSYALPRPADDHPRRVAASAVWREVADTFVEFFKKKHLVTALAFMLLYKLAEAQLVKMIAPFLLDSPDAGGLGLSTVRVGLTYGTIGLCALMGGGIAGGFVAARYGLRRCMMPMAWSMSLTCVTFVVLAMVHDPSVWFVDVCVALEQAGYGFGTTAYTLYLLNFSAGARRTSFYAICTGIMALGMMVPGMWAGWLQEAVGYTSFFIFTMLCCTTTIVVAHMANRSISNETYN